MKITINLEMPQTDSPYKSQVPALTPQERVRDALEEIMSGRESRREWSLVSKIYRDLVAKRNLNETEQNIKQMIEPVMAKFGYHGVSSEK